MRIGKRVHTAVAPQINYGYSSPPVPLSLVLEELAIQHGINLTDDIGEDVIVADNVLSTHALLCGGSGSGKTRLMLAMIEEQLRAGCSAVVLDTKDDTILHILDIAKRLGITPDRIDLVWPRIKDEGIPGWNLLQAEPRDIEQVVTAFVDILNTDGSLTDAMQIIVRNAATVIAGQKLSILELIHFLKSPSYRERILAEARQTELWRMYREEHSYFVTDYADVAESSTVTGLIRRLRTITGKQYLSSMFTADMTTVDIPGLWKEQRLLLVFLDNTDIGLGKPAAALMAGFFANRVFATAQQKPGKRPVLVCLDEASLQQKVIGEQMVDILAVGRSMNLRLITACQHLDQVSPVLRKSLMQAGFQAFFRIDPDDAAKIASYAKALEGKDHTPIEKIDVKYTLVEETFPILLSDGRQVYMNMIDSKIVNETAPVDPTSNTNVERMLAYRKLLKMNNPLLSFTYNNEPGYVQKGNEQIPAMEFCQKLDELGFTSQIYYRNGTIAVVPKYPQVSFTITNGKPVAKDYLHEIVTLPKRHCLVKVEDQPFVHMITADFPDAPKTPNPRDFIGRGQSATVLRETEDRRYARMEKPDTDAGATSLGVPKQPTTPPVLDFNLVQGITDES